MISATISIHGPLFARAYRGDEYSWVIFNNSENVGYGSVVIHTLSYAAAVLIADAINEAFGTAQKETAEALA
jgi:hypothetical protein